MLGKEVKAAKGETVDVVVSGSSGLIGTALVEALAAAGHRPIRLVRGDARGEVIRWDPKAGTIDAASLEGVGAAVHLAGAGIGDHRWTEDYKREIRESRTVSTDLLARTLASLSRPPSVLLSGSAIGYYGDRGDEVLTEASAGGDTFLADVCQAWEAATAPASEADLRVVHLRTGIVLSADGGALKKQLPLFKLGLGGRFGSGRQWQSWIAIDDWVGAALHLLEHDVVGPVNLTAPNPVTNAEFASTLGRVLHRPAFVPVPRFGPKLVLGAELADSLLFESQRVLPSILHESGHQVAHADLEPALRAVLGRPAT
jgi:uncharacterized protein (TIGR01777 family)